MSTTSWQRGALTATGAMGLAMARIQASPIGVDRLPHADGIDLGRGRERADHDRNIVAPALGVRHMGEQEGAPLVLGHAAQELPAHQRMQLGILVDGAVDANEQTLRLKIGQMILKIEARGRRAADERCEAAG